MKNLVLNSQGFWPSENIFSTFILEKKRKKNETKFKLSINNTQK